MIRNKEEKEHQRHYHNLFKTLLDSKDSTVNDWYFDFEKLLEINMSLS